eukprot:6177392-Pleurochrysis_carterae.AAC.3
MLQQPLILNCTPAQNCGLYGSQRHTVVAGMGIWAKEQRGAALPSHGARAPKHFSARARICICVRSFQVCVRLRERLRVPECACVCVVVHVRVFARFYMRACVGEGERARAEQPARRTEISQPRCNFKIGYKNARRNRGQQSLVDRHLQASLTGLRGSAEKGDASLLAELLRSSAVVLALELK